MSKFFQNNTIIGDFCCNDKGFKLEFIIYNIALSLNLQPKVELLIGRNLCESLTLVNTKYIFIIFSDINFYKLTTELGKLY
jgi:hypothetical protein